MAHRGFPHNGPPSQLPAFFPSHSALSKGPSGEVSGIPGPVEAIPRTWPKGETLTSVSCLSAWEAGNCFWT